jgi:hypothetical protein
MYVTRSPICQLTMSALGEGHTKSRMDSSIVFMLDLLLLGNVGRRGLPRNEETKTEIERTTQRADGEVELSVMVEEYLPRLAARLGAPRWTGALYAKGQSPLHGAVSRSYFELLASRAGV